MTTPRRALACVLLGALALAGCTSSSAGRGEHIIGGGVTTVDAISREPVPSLTGELLGGGRFDLSDYRGRVVVLNFWASWCGPCTREAPVLKSLSDELKPLGADFVGVDVRDQRTSARAFLDRYGIQYPSIFDQPAESVLAFDGKLPANPPNTVILDRQGRVAARITGETSASTLRPLITDVLDEKS
jgi:thiol-disulfide isomerase/thioredoxin